MKVLGVIPSTYMDRNSFIVEVSSGEMQELAGLFQNQIGAIRPGFAFDVVKLCSELRQLRSKRGFLAEQARQMRAVAELMDAVAPSYNAAVEHNDAADATTRQEAKQDGANSGAAKVSS